MTNHGGTRKGAGRKSNSEIKAFRELIDAALKPDDWMDIIRALAELAKTGKPGASQAAQLLFANRFGLPTIRHAGDEDLPPIQIVKIHVGPA